MFDFSSLIPSIPSHFYDALYLVYALLLLTVGSICFYYYRSKVFNKNSLITKSDMKNSSILFTPLSFMTGCGTLVMYSESCIRSHGSKWFMLGSLVSLFMCTMYKTYEISTASCKKKSNFWWSCIFLAVLMASIDIMGVRFIAHHNKLGHFMCLCLLFTLLSKSRFIDWITTTTTVLVLLSVLATCVITYGGNYGISAYSEHSAAKLNWADLKGFEFIMGLTSMGYVCDFACSFYVVDVDREATVFGTSERSMLRSMLFSMFMLLLISLSISMVCDYVPVTSSKTIFLDHVAHMINKYLPFGVSFMDLFVVHLAVLTCRTQIFLNQARRRLFKSSLRSRKSDILMDVLTSGAMLLVMYKLSIMEEHSSLVSKLTSLFMLAPTALSLIAFSQVKKVNSSKG